MTATQVGTDWNNTIEIVKDGFAITPRPVNYPIELATARAAVEASFSATDKPLEADGVNHYGLPKQSPFPSEAVRYGEQPVTPETAKEAALMQAFSDLTRNAIAPSFEI